MGRGTPIMPVLATNTSATGIPSFLATRLVISFASVRPCSLVQALAQPELITTARAFLPASLSWHTNTGAALTLLVVRTPAAVQETSE
jgi:hypothetical protein